MMKVLVTGGAGFVGSHLTAFLQKTEKYDITIFDKLENKSPEKNIHYFKGDIISKRDVAKVFKEYGPFTTIFHLASAMPNKEFSDEMIWKINVEGIKNLAQEAVKYDAKSFVFTSSNVTYGIPKELPTTEETPMKPFEMYGKSKVQAEKVLESYKDKMNIQIIRLPVTIGTGRLGLLAILFEFISENRNVYVLGDGSNIYQFAGVEDVCLALERSSHRQGFAVYNIGADKKMSLKEVYKKVIQYAVSKSKIISVPKTPTLFLLRLLDILEISPLGIYQYTMISQSLYTDTTKIKKELTWKPKKTNADIFIDSYKWYIKHKKEFATGKHLSANRSLPKMGIFKIVKLLS